MAYLGTPIDTTNQFQSLQGKRFSGDGSTTAFTLDIAPSSVFDIEVFVENVRQDPNSAYGISGTTLTFTGAPASGTNNIYVVHQAKAVGTIDVPASGVVPASLASNIISGQTALAATPADTDEFLVSDAGTIKRIDFSHIQGVYESKLLHVRDEKSANTAGGSSSSTTNNERVLNTVVTNEITGASLSSDTITLPSGTYFISASSPTNRGGTNRAHLYNTADSSIAVLGTSENTQTSDTTPTRSFITGRFTIAAQKTFKIRHYTTSAKSDNGLGVQANDGNVEVYTDVQIWKVA